MERRRRHTEPHVNHERWVLSYADFVTLMFALFVAMYAISMKNHSSAKAISDSVRHALKSGGIESVKEFLNAPPPKPDLDPVKPQGEDASLVPAYRQLQNELQHEVQAGAVRLSLEKRGLVITLQEKPFFPSGTDSLNDRTYPTLEHVAKIIAGVPNGVRLEGHTDSVPIRNSRFKDNWELSAARSIALLELFESKFGVSAGKFAVAGYADNVPVASNSTEEGRASNRRVEIILLSQSR